jgi:L-glyceraldehyde 3-phosphate reductase
MFDRTPEAGLLDVLEDKGIGCIAFSPLAQGLLTDRYLNGIPENSRASKAQFLKPEQITTEQIKIIVALNDIAQNRNQTLAQMALAWLLKDNRITSVLIGASSVGQLQNNIDALDNLDFTKAELDNIEAVLASL